MICDHCKTSAAQYELTGGLCHRCTAEELETREQAMQKLDATLASLEEDMRQLTATVEREHVAAVAMVVVLEKLATGDLAGTPINKGSSAMLLIENALAYAKEAGL